MKKKKILAFLLTLIVLISSISISLYAFGSDITWQFDENSKTLFIYGSGKMDDFSDAFSSPWSDIIMKVQKVDIEDGITSVGSFAFAGADYLTEAVIPDSVTSVGSFSFSSCSLLKRLSFGENITSISDKSFAFNGVVEKTDFVLECSAGSFSLYYAVKNSIAFDTPSVTCSTYAVHIAAKGGMKAYFPYTAKVSGTFKFYSEGTHDTQGFLYDSSFKQLAYNDDSPAGGTNFSITCQFSAGQTYYIAASILNASLLGNFSLVIEPVRYTVTASVKAMADPSGAPGDIPLTTATMNGAHSDDGVFSFTVTPDNDSAVFAFGNSAVTHKFSPDEGDVTITFLVCDVNHDGWVNAKDYAIMRKTSSPYIDLYKNFINYHIE